MYFIALRNGSFGSRTGLPKHLHRGNAPFAAHRQLRRARQTLPADLALDPQQDSDQFQGLGRRLGFAVQASLEHATGVHPA